ncbi:lipid A deacylase LpxR family protein [Rubellicoccus peritrichatus]|uniref:Lipid A deacylase LpxR family protein n=1 Tax=Rubellicoccus peritrichatus TaxID=3080537 RepID=A0AAQ3LEG8_9BACT|nr:lipid A deacylase LpxR family protein [Puniceicoccus sp. CR14]WOO42133.1 lipid A deacylase LpxR family protein [Puniceicoccus sp. CR14]
MKFFSTCLLAGLISLSPSLNAAESDGDSFGFIFENDIFGGSDKYYSSGQQLNFSMTLESSSDTSDRIQFLDQDWLPFYGRPGERRVNTFTFGQQIYTPANISIAAPQPNDRPWAGWLYGSAFFSRASEESLTTFGVTLGLVGPGSGAEDVQKFIHEHITDSPDPKGWDNQLSNEPGIILAYQKTWRIGAGNAGSFGWDVLPNAGAAVGNVYVQASGGGMFRFGWRLPQDFGIGGIRPGSSTTLAPDILPLQDPEGFRFYGFAGGQILAVAHDIFLNGNTFKDSASISAKPIIGYIQIGATLAYDNFRFSYLQRYSSKEFRNQPSGQWLGAVTATVQF